MKKSLFVILFFAICASSFAQSITLPSNSAAVTDNALSTKTNPAWLGIRPDAEMFLLFPYTDSTSNEDMGLVVKLGPIGFAGEFVNNDLAFYNRYTLATGFKLGGEFYLGVSHSWYRVVDWQGSWNVGLGYRPLPFVSAGAVVFDLNQPNCDGVGINPSYNLSLAVRPFDYRLTLSGDLLFTKDATHDYGDKLDPRFRLELMPMDGIRLMGEYQTDSEKFSVGLSLAVDNVALGNQRVMDKDAEHLNSVGYIHFTSARQKNFISPQSHQIVEVTLSGKIAEAEPPFSFFGMGKTKTLQHLRQEIQHYAEDPHVDGLLITFDNPEIGLAQMEQLGRSLEEFKASGKTLIAYSEQYSQKDYYLAAKCDEINLLPVGVVDLKGLAAVLGYWKGTLDKLGVGVQVVRVRDYKTAANAFMFEDSPEAEREMINWLLDDIYNQLCSNIAEGRGWTLDEVKDRINGGPYIAPWALEAGLVDTLVYYDEIVKNLEDQDFVLVNEKSYWRLPEYKESWPDIRVRKVAIIYAEGDIVSGESGGNLFGTKLMGAQTISEAIRTAREDGSVDAIILRVDSPGGSGVASDVIYREVRRTVTDERNRKPFIVSMGNVAGSGGYYISCAADTIIAEEGTITGSIGVIAGKINLQGLHKKIYYNTNTFKRGDHADAWSMSRPLDDQEMETLQNAVEDFYKDFVNKIAESRGISEAAIDSVGEGRVWTGKQAMEKGLVDLIGGMDVAFAVTRARLGLRETAPLQLEYYPKPRGLFSTFVAGVVQSRSGQVPPALAEAIEPLSLAAEFYNGEPLLLMPLELQIK